MADASPRLLTRIGLLLLASIASAAGTRENVLLVVNQKSAMSRRLGEFYSGFQSLKPAQICRLDTAEAETIERAKYRQEIEIPVENCLRGRGLTESTYYVVLTQGIPIRISPTTASKDWIRTDGASVDSELALLYARMKGLAVPLGGPQNNPFFERKNEEFRHPAFPIYMVTRLAGYSFEDAKKAVERCRGAKNTGKVVIDQKSADDNEGNNWLRNAALFVPADRVIHDESPQVVKEAKDVIAYASWGSNDKQRQSRKSGMQWLPGSIATEFVSTNARSFQMPPTSWSLGTWSDAKTFFMNSPQSLILDYVWEGVSGIAGNVDEPYLGFCSRPDVLIPAYLNGRNLAESFYLSLPALSWQSIVIGDPLCRLN